MPWLIDPQPWAELPVSPGYIGSGLGEDLSPELAPISAASPRGQEACLGDRSPVGVRLRALRESVDDWPLAITILQLFGGQPKLVAVLRNVTGRRYPPLGNRMLQFWGRSFAGFRRSVTDRFLGNSVGAIGCLVRFFGGLVLQSFSSGGRLVSAGPQPNN